MLVIDTLPDAFPDAVGAKVTVNVELAPGFILVGMFRPLSVNPVPVTDAFEIVRATLPVLVTVIACGVFPPTETFPKATVAGFADSWP